MTVRIYVPTTSRGLAAIVADGRIPGPVNAHAVTEALQEAWPDGDEEEWEYAAMAAAGDDSWAARSDVDQPRRYVVAADVREVQPGEGDEPTSVRVEFDVPWKNIASAHVDTEDFTGDDTELAWFATQEIPDLL